MTQPDIDSLWNPALAGDGELERIQALLAPLAAPPPPVIELPPRSSRRGPSMARPLAGVLIGLAAACALWWVSRVVVVEPPSSVGAGVAEVRSGWQVEPLEGQPNCREAEVEAGVSLPAGATLETDGESSARLSRGSAQLELYPSSALRDGGDGMTLVHGRLWADLREGDSTGPWRLWLGPLELETTSARFVASYTPGLELELELVSGEVELVEGGRTSRVRGGQTCRAELALGPIEQLETLACEVSPEPP